MPKITDLTRYLINMTIYIHEEVIESLLDQ